MARGRSSGRQKEWGGGPFASASLGITQSVIATLSFSQQRTLIRSRGNLLISGVPDAAGDDTVVGLGLIVLADEAIAAGGAAVPGPIANEIADWLWHQFVPLRAEVTGANDASIASTVRVELDSKAMRKVNATEGISLIAELSTAEYSSVNLTGGFRILTLLG